MKIVGMSGLLMGLLSLMFTVLYISSQPILVEQLFQLNVPFEISNPNELRFPPSVPFAVAGIVASAIAIRTYLGKFSFLLCGISCSFLLLMII